MWAFYSSLIACFPYLSQFDVIEQEETKKKERNESSLIIFKDRRITGKDLFTVFHYCYNEML